jgi:NCAIR mutase (PurE)-related protein
MDPSRLEALLRAVQAGSTSVDEAMGALRDFPYDDLGFARLDTHRALRTGHPEVVFCQNKTPDQCAAIAERLAEGADRVLMTRASSDVAEAVTRRLPEVTTYHEMARCLVVGAPPEPRADAGYYIAVVSAGTADMPVAEESVVTLETLGSPVQRLYDVGVAGLHRLLDRRDVLTGARAIVVCAGMEGALASVVGGLVACPVVACPTSVGYGASFGGVSALLTMLNSCATGVAVVNIDNGFGAGYFAHLVAAVGAPAPVAP